MGLLRESRCETGQTARSSVTFPLVLLFLEAVSIETF